LRFFSQINEISNQKINERVQDPLMAGDSAVYYSLLENPL